MSLKNITRYAFAFVFALLAGASPTVGRDDRCLDAEVVEDPDLSKLPDGRAFEEALSTEFGRIRLRELRYDFSENDGIVRVREQFVLDFSDVIEGIRNDAYSKVKSKESCNAIFTPGGYSLAPTGAGNLGGGLSIDATFRACQIFDVPCIKGWKITTCRVVWKEDIDDHTFGVDISLNRIFFTNEERQSAKRKAEATHKAELDRIEKLEDPLSRHIAKANWDKAVDADLGALLCGDASITGRALGAVQVENASFCGQSSFDERGDGFTRPWIKNLILNVVGIVTLNIGSKFILDTYRSKMSDAHSMIDRAFSANLPGRAELIGDKGLADVFLRDMKIDQAATAFRYSKTATDRYVAFYHVAEHPQTSGIKRRTFCEVVRPVIAQYGALLRSTVIGDQEVVVGPKVSLWGIAESLYGSGYYHLTLLPANDIEFRNAGKLVVGQRIKVPAMYKIWSGQSRVVQIGDSLWGIASKDLHDPTVFNRIYKDNSQFLESPNRIYPVQMLQITR